MIKKEYDKSSFLYEETFDIVYITDARPLGETVIVDMALIKSAVDLCKSNDKFSLSLNKYDGAVSTVSALTTISIDRDETMIIGSHTIHIPTKDMIDFISKGE